MISIIIPSRNEQFLQKTTEDILAKAKGEIEVIVVLEGYWPEVVVKDPRVHYIHNGTPKGLRGAVMQAVEIAKGKHIMKIDAHCKFSEGFDVELANSCETDYVVVPQRYSLDAEKWKIEERDDDKYPIDYLYIECPSDKNKGDLGGEVWREKNRNPKFKDKYIDDLMTFQGSCWFMEKEYFSKLELFDEKNYGTFRKEPQEISFKCWLSGGRVIRNKKAWYAHLYKGKKYGRGYSFAKGDWEKGDEYNKKWLTNSAWDKQTKDFKWLIDKFSPPGWKDYDWDGWKKNAKTVNEEIKSGLETAEGVAKKVVKNVKGKLYQNIGEKEGEFCWQNPKKKKSKYWNEGKWDNFIAPLLPEDCKDQTFVEMGCNAGLFLKLATEKGFRDVVGVEKDKTPCKEGIRYRDLLGHNYKILKRKMGDGFGGVGTFDIDEIPIADYTLLSTFHYYIEIDVWLKYLDLLKNKTRYCIVVSRPTKREHWRALGELKAVKKYFEDWEQVGEVKSISANGDPSPREDMYSICFKSKLGREKMEDIKTENSDKKMFKAKVALAELAVKNDKIDLTKTDYFQQWVNRKKDKWSSKLIKEFVTDKFNRMVDVRKNGLIEPLIIQSNGKISDGGHRLVMLKALNYKSTIVRYI